MKKLFLFLVVGWLSLSCSADTIYEQFNDAVMPADWTQYIGPNASAGDTWFSYPGGYLSVAMTRCNLDSGAAYVKTSLGEDTIAASTAWDVMPEMWFSTDVKWIRGTNSADPIGYFGIFNDDYDTDYNPGMNFLGAVFKRGYGTGSNQLGVYLRAHRTGGDSTTSSRLVTGTVLTMTGNVGDTFRIAIHCYQGGTDYMADITVTNLTSPSEPVQSQTGFGVLAGAYSFWRGLDSFGVRNGTGSVGVVNTYGFDNMYFSATGPLTCVDSTGDFTGDCEVNLADLAVLSDEWLDCATVPARLCD